MKKLNLLVGTLVLGLGITLACQSPAAAAKVYDNHAPAVLRHNWVSPLYRTPKSQRDARNYYWYRNLYVTNTQFHLEDFMLSKNRTASYNSGPYGAFKGYYNLAYEKLSSCHYLVEGSMQPSGTKKVTEYGIALSHNYRTLKLYDFNHLKVIKDTVYPGKAHYVGKFHRGTAHYQQMMP
ncbi:hypothetical protein [Lentilactobacillus kisonensis]|uniref:SCP domain-containing protein n=1 Tax=Lentilactobacillus kisonensis F0435 TaxID=797516 RepID=H1LGV5_9LACO|nr:hypothetical protein [Lentilactobacillus kisonensis]EHO50735.1 hypothetical protein HMPREF9104_01834 [Lentilactobacillus kisonensis F0435]